MEPSQFARDRGCHGPCCLHSFEQLLARDSPLLRPICDFIAFGHVDPPAVPWTPITSTVNHGTLRCCGPFSLPLEGRGGARNQTHHTTVVPRYRANRIGLCGAHSRFSPGSAAASSCCSSAWALPPTST